MTQPHAPHPRLTHTHRVTLAGLTLFALALTIACITHPLPRRNISPLDLHTRIPINLASAADLQLLPHVGPAIAQHIITTRNKRHGFHKLSDLLQVKGIGPTTLHKIAPLITFTPTTTQPTN